jgi:hypothetical protein
MDNAATWVGLVMASGGVFRIDTGRRMEMSIICSCGGTMLDMQMLGIFSAMLVFWIAVAGLIYFVA